MLLFFATVNYGERHYIFLLKFYLALKFDKFNQIINLEEFGDHKKFFWVFKKYRNLLKKMFPNYEKKKCYFYTFNNNNLKIAYLDLKYF